MDKTELKKPTFEQCFVYAKLMEKIYQKNYSLSFCTAKLMDYDFLDSENNRLKKMITPIDPDSQ